MVNFRSYSSENHMSDEQDIGRRWFMCEAASGVAGVAALATGLQAKEPRTIDDPSITHGPVEWRSGDHAVDGYLARP